MDWARTSSGDSDAGNSAGLGLRQGEAFGPSWSRVHSDQVMVDRQLGRISNGSELVSLNTERSYRTIPLPRWADDDLEQYREMFGKDDPDGLCFVATQRRAAAS